MHAVILAVASLFTFFKLFFSPLFLHIFCVCCFQLFSSVLHNTHNTIPHTWFVGRSWRLSVKSVAFVWLGFFSLCDVMLLCRKTKLLVFWLPSHKPKLYFFVFDNYFKKLWALFLLHFKYIVKNMILLQLDTEFLFHNYPGFKSFDVLISEGTKLFLFFPLLCAVFPGSM